jgi:hypothetical protein
VEKFVTARQVTDDITRRMRIACKITKATATHSECVILIDFSRQKWFRELASLLRYTYIACLVIASCTCTELLQNALCIVGSRTENVHEYGERQSFY